VLFPAVTLNRFPAVLRTVFSLTTKVRIWGSPSRSGSIA
jgi:hypothetical protein